MQPWRKRRGGWYFLNTSFSPKNLHSESNNLFNPGDMKNLFFFFIALFFSLLHERVAAQCTTQAATLFPDDLHRCYYAGPFNLSFINHNNDQVLDANDVIKYVLHDGTPTTLGNVLAFSTLFTNWMTLPGGLTPGVTYQIAAIAGNPDGNGGVDLNDPCLSFNGGISLVLHNPQVVTVNDPVIGCNEYGVDLTVNISPPGNYQIEWDNWLVPELPQNVSTVNVTNEGWYNVYVTDLLSGCGANDTAHVTLATGKPSVQIQQQNGGSCGQMNVTANVTGGVGPFDFIWGDGSTLPTQLLPSGTHCVSVTGANGCVAKDCIVVQDPGNLNVSLVFFQGSDCGQTRLEATVVGQVGGVTYSWSSGSSAQFYNEDFAIGENYVTVTDGAGCEAIASYFVDVAPVQCGTLKLRLFDDLDLNCGFNGNDFRLANFKISILDAANQQVFYGNTYNYPDGFSWSGRLFPGDYTVAVELPNNLWQGCQPSYAVTVNPGLTTELNLPLQAVEPCQDMRMDLAAGELNWCSPNNYVTLYYANKGTVEATNAYVELQLEPHLTINSFNVPYADLGADLYRFDLGTVGVGVSGYIFLTIGVDCSATIGATPCLTATIFPNEPCPSAINADWSGASLRVTSQCDGNEVKFVIENVGTADMTTPLGYVIIEDAVMFMDVPNDPPLPQGGTKEINLPANGSTWRIEVAQEPLHPGQSMPSLALEGCESFGSMGFVNMFPPNDGDSFVDIECITISAAYDPNDKQGLPLGVGENHLIRPGTDIEYMIRFQNTGTDTAETVVIRDTLDQWLDPLSIEPGAASHPYRFDYFGEGSQIKFTFENIMLLDSNLNEPASHGFVKFRVKHRPGIPLGTDIHNQAAIYFDYNPPIFTNTTQHRIGEIFLLESTSEPGYEYLNLTVKPNPVVGQATIMVEGGDDLDGLQASLFDALGRPVVNLIKTYDGFLLDRGGLPSGIYFVRVVGKDGAAVAAAKVMVQ
jgi:uncharacterized repeat protein (TIGR01451 family)